MSVIRITVEDELYQAMKEISRVKGISVSASIAAYLRAVVETNSLAINTSLPSVPRRSSDKEQMKKEEPKAQPEKDAPPEPEAPVKEEASPEPVPDDRAVSADAEEAAVPAEETAAGRKSGRTLVKAEAAIPPLEGLSAVEKFIALICLIPDGFLSTWEDLETAIGSDKPLHDEWPKTTAITEGGEVRKVAIPYWRVLSWRGSTKGELTCSRDLRETMLTAEGHEVITTGRGIKVVRGYRHKLVKWKSPEFSGEAK